MKKIIMIMVCAFTINSINAQQSNNNNKPQHPVVTKGYYSVPHQAKKLAKKGVFTDANAQVDKGFYATEANKKKIVRKRERYSHTKPVVTKGYYSLPQNYKKLYGNY